MTGLDLRELETRLEYMRIEGVWDRPFEPVERVAPPGYHFGPWGELCEDEEY